MKDGSSAITGSKYTISNDWHVIELEWQVASMPGANDGFLSFWIDGVLIGTISGVDNDTTVWIKQGWEQPPGWMQAPLAPCSSTSLNPAAIPTLDHKFYKNEVK